LIRRLAFLSTGLALISIVAAAEPVPVQLRQTDEGWQLLRGGEPYLIRGAGGTASLENLAALGANSIRTWSIDGAEQILDQAHANGMTVTLGIWLGHERHGFDYGDRKQVAAQFERVREIVLKYRDHPALLLWGIGNEMEEFESGDDPAVWKAVNDIAAMVKELDPHHPTMTVTSEVGGGRITSLHQRSPAIDIHGINTYGGAQSVAERLREGGATKPYVITEFGPVGPWEAPTTDWGAPYEQTSTQKANFYRQSFEKAVLESGGQSLGAYAFLWGHKMEGTATWFGMLLEDGAKLGAVDAMSEIWSGKPPVELAPIIEPIAIDIDPEMEPGATFTASTSAADPDGDEVTFSWVLRPESGDYHTGGDFRETLPDVGGAVLESSSGIAKIRMPEEPGPYRLFAYVYDQSGSAATANIPLLVKGKIRPRFPIAVYEDRLENMRWVPTGWMGNARSLTLDSDYSDNVHEGERAIRMHYAGRNGWAGVAWQHPPENWGEQDGGFDLTGAAKLEIWARGERGGEKVSFGVGLIDDKSAYPDTAIVKTRTIQLTEEWRRYDLPLVGEDLSSLKTGFVVTLEAGRRPVTVYLDSVRFTR
jgi:hypothetical protein